MIAEPFTGYAVFASCEHADGTIRLARRMFAKIDEARRFATIVSWFGVEPTIVLWSQARERAFEQAVAEVCDREVTRP